MQEILSVNVLEDSVRVTQKNVQIVVCRLRLEMESSVLQLVLLRQTKNRTIIIAYVVPTVVHVGSTVVHARSGVVHSGSRIMHVWSRVVHAGSSVVHAGPE